VLRRSQGTGEGDKQKSNKRKAATELVGPRSVNSRNRAALIANEFQFLSPRRKRAVTILSLVNYAA
jgi:hypothetical protein